MATSLSALDPAAAAAAAAEVLSAVALTKCQWVSSLLDLM
jgi:hypothetical protein